MGCAQSRGLDTLSYSRVKQLVEQTSKKPSDDGEACKNWLVAQDEEIGNAMLVSALVFTVAASSILAPASQNIDGEHTDLYGALCVMSLLGNLASVLLGTLMRRSIKLALLYQPANTDQAVEFIEMSVTRMWYSLPSVFMWIGTITMTVAIAVNVHEVLGSTSYQIMFACSVMLLLILVFGYCQMETQRLAHGLCGKFDRKPLQVISADDTFDDSS